MTRMGDVAHWANIIPRMKFKNEELKVAADAIRVLVADMVEQANSGHPGGAMGQADVAATLWLAAGG